MKRQEKAGFNAVIFYLKHPELKDFLFPSKCINFSWGKIIYKIYGIFLKFKSKGLSFKEKIYSNLLSYAYNRGAKRGFSEFRDVLK